MRFPLPILYLACLCLPALLQGQGNSSFCSNTALVPVFKQDFGQSPTATASTTAPVGSTNYNFGNVGTDGNYIVTSRVENANKSDWTKGRDHTGNANGNFFLVNAGGNRNIFLQQTVTGLCPGSSYSFTAWLANVNTPLTNSICGNNPVYPRITFNILDLSDNLLATYTTNNLPLSPNAGPVNWQKYGFQFSLPVNTTALKIQMVDFWGGGPACGNDVALDDILFEACVPNISVSLSGGDNVCIGKDINLESSLVNSPYTAPAYLWQKSNNNGNTWDTLGTPGLGFNQFPILNAQLKDSGWYRVLVAPTATNILNVTCGAISNTVKLVVNPLPKLKIQSNAPICSGNTLTLSALATGGSGTYAQFNWQGPIGFSDSTANLARPQAPTAFSGTYWAQVLDSKGCTDTANISVQIDSTPVLQWVNLTDSICSKSNVSAAVQASLPQSNIRWTAVNPHGIQLTGNFTTSINHQFLGSAQHAQNQSLNWQLQALATTSQGCNSSLLDSTIVVHALPAPAIAGPDQIICANNTALQAQLPATGTGSWHWISPTDSSVYNGQKFSTTDPVLNNNQNPQSPISFSQLAHYALQWLVSTPFCGTQADTVLITRIPPPQPVLAVADATLCGPASFSFFNQSPLANHYGFIWQLGDGSPDQVFPAGSLANDTNGLAQTITKNFLPAVNGGDTSYTITLKSFNNCDTISTTQRITVKQKPRINLSISTTGNCSPQTLTAQVTSSGNDFSQRLLWGDGQDTSFAAPLNGLLQSFSLQHIYLPSAASQHQLVASATNACGTDSVVVLQPISQNNLVVNTHLKDSSICGIPARFSFQNFSTGAHVAKVNWGDGSGWKNLVTNNMVSLSHQYADTGKFTVQLHLLGTCADSLVSATIHINALPAAALAGPDQIICANNTALQAQLPATGTGSWHWISPTDSSVHNGQKFSTIAPVLNNNQSPQSRIGFSQLGHYALQWLVSTPFCGTQADTVLITRIPPPQPVLAVADATLCGPASFSFFNQSPLANHYGFLWQLGDGSPDKLFPAGSLSNDASGWAQTITKTFLPAVNGGDTSYTITLKAFNNCDTISTTQRITVKQKPKAVLVAKAANICYPLVVTWENASRAEQHTAYRLHWPTVDSSWGSGNQLTSTLQNAASPLPYLKASNACGTDSSQVKVVGQTNSLSIRNSLTDTAVCRLPFQLTWQDASIGFTQLRTTWSDETNGNATTTQRREFLQAGTYQVNQTYSNVCGDSTVRKTIVVRPPVKAQWEVQSSKACVGEPILLQNRSAKGLAIHWLINDSLAGQTDSLHFVGRSAGIYRSALAVSQSYPEITCADTLRQNLTITQTAAGKIDPLATQINCLTSAISLSTQQVSGTKIEWRINDSLWSQQTADTLRFQQNGDYKIKLNALQPNGCLYTDSTQVKVETPTGKITYKGGTYCLNANSTVTFMAQWEFASAVQVDFGDGTSALVYNKNFSHQYAQAGKYLPRFVLLGKDGCSQNLPLGDSIHVVAVQAQFNINNQYNCGLTEFQFNNNASATEPIVAWEWSTNKTVFSRTKNASQAFQSPGLREFQLRVETLNGCSAQVQAIVPVTIYAFPKVNIQALNETCLKSQMELRSNVQSADSIVQKLWYLGNGNQANDTTVRVVYLNEGKITVRFLAATVNQCYDSALKQITIHPLPIVQLTPQQKVCLGDSLVLKADGAVKYTWKDQQENILCDNCISFKVKPLRNTAYSVVGKNEFGCVQSASTTVRVIEKFSITASATDSICVGATAQLRAGGAAHYQWLPQTGLLQAQGSWATVQPQQTTTYQVVGRDADKCFTDTANIKVIVGGPTAINIGKDTVVLAGTQMKLKAKTSLPNIQKYRWSGGADLSCVNCPEPTIQLTKDVCVTCTATNGYGCVSRDTLCIKTLCPTTEVFIANAFTPDGDGVNDRLFVQGAGISMVRYFRVFNRWGEMVFESRNHFPNDASKGWDGRIRGQAAAPEVYVWMAEVVCEKGAIQLYKGNSAIIK